MTKGNKVLEALETVRKRIDEEVAYAHEGEEQEDGLYDAKGIHKVLREEINKAVREGEKKLKPKRTE